MSESFMARSGVPVNPKGLGKLERVQSEDNFSNSNDATQLIVGTDDVAGCRFNSDTSELESAQNGTMFGKPLSDCTASNLESSKTTGSIFYPIN